jgi:hypothetical protein
MTPIWLVCVVLTVAVAGGEAFLLSFWVPAYFRTGVRVVRTAVHLPAADVDLADLADECGATLFRPRLAFRQISSSEVAFQEAALPPTLWSPIPVLRGLVLIDPARRRAEVVGILLWYPIVGVAALFLGLASEGPVVALSVGVAAACATWAMGTAQWWRYGRVLHALRGGPEPA